MHSPTELTELFRSRGLKVTPQRQLLFRLLHGNESHPTADALFAAAVREMPGISRRTVYQTLNDLAEMGELLPLALDAGAVRFDPNVVDHHHLVCSVCGLVRDVYLDDTSALGDELRAQLSTELDGFHLDDVAVVFSGRCPSCGGP